MTGVDPRHSGLVDRTEGGRGSWQGGGSGRGSGEDDPLGQRIVW